MDGIAESVREEHARHLANSPPLGPLELARSPERVLPYMRYLHLERRRSDSGSGVSLWATPIRGIGTEDEHEPEVRSSCPR